MKIVDFNSISHREWDEYVNKIEESSYLHSSWYIEYLNAINGKENGKSFILFDGNSPIAVCPLAVSKINKYGMEYIESTFNGNPNPYPAVIKLPSTQRRRTVRKIFALIHQILEPYGTKRIEFDRNPINLGVLKGDSDFTNISEALSFGYFCHIKNTIIIDLRQTEEQLISEMSMYQRKHIRKSKRQGLVIKEFRGNIDVIDKIFSDFQAAHLKSAGKLTRPIESWNVMRELLRSGKSSLFVATTKEGKDISYLYCGEFDKFSIGWSQVNIDEYEKEYSPRHLLEWETILAYKRREFSFYEVGLKLDSPQLNYIPTEKEITITQFKERYGGKLFCHFYFEKFIDKNLFHAVYNDRIKRLSDSVYFDNRRDEVSNMVI